MATGVGSYRWGAQRAGCSAIAYTPAGLPHTCWCESLGVSDFFKCLKLNFLSLGIYGQIFTLLLSLVCVPHPPDLGWTMGQTLGGILGPVGPDFAVQGPVSMSLGV